MTYIATYRNPKASPFGERVYSGPTVTAEFDAAVTVEEVEEAARETAQEKGLELVSVERL